MFKGKTIQSLMHQHLSQGPPYIRTVRSDIPEAVSEIIRRMLAKSPADRFATAEEFGQTLSVAMASLRCDSGAF